MPLFHWSKSNSVFLPAIGDERRTIFQANALDGCAPLSKVQEILYGLIRCAEDYFAHEEKLMRGAHDLAFDWHRQQHDTARKRLASYRPLIEAETARQHTNRWSF
jgi:hemerythrin